MEIFLDGPALWFTVPALLGTMFFLVRLVLLALGGDHGDFGAGHVDAGGLVHGGMDSADPAGHHADSGMAAQYLSVQGITAFFMGFGWAGLSAYAGFGWRLVPSFGVALAGGVLMTLLVATLFRGVRRLEASGTLNLDAAMGAAGEVYLTVPARGKGQGQVRVVLADRQRIVNAVSDGSELPTRSRVRVVRVNTDNTVTVVPA
ncbi:MAG: hypothetical protein EYC70_13800 [Planctomycetota bacterium]|nr:MAG: hypothetical protein EYC70_13800 [Planctomycetota bacterium]